MSKSPVVHFEMPYKDPKRIAKFYEEAFGWKVNDAGEQMGHYLVAQTAETDDNNMVQTPGAINGGFYHLAANQNLKEPSVVISVEDINQAMDSIKNAGGEILGEVQDIPTVGLWVSFKDSEGNRASVLQAKI